MLFDHAVEALKEDDKITSDCNQAFWNFLAATQGVARRDLRGAIETAADRIDGIVRFGKSEMDRIGRIEEEVNGFFTTEANYPIGSGSVKGAVSERSVIAASQLIINDLQQILASHEDYYFYIIEQYVRLRVEPGIRTLLDGVPLFEIECELVGEIGLTDDPQSPGIAYIEEIRPSIVNWCKMTVPTLASHELSVRVIGAAYGHFRMNGKPQFDEIRRGYARHNRDRCLKDGEQADAERWAAVVAGL